MLVFGEQSLPILISNHEAFIIFSLPCQAAEESDRVELVSVWHPARFNPPLQVKCPVAYMVYNLF